MSGPKRFIGVNAYESDRLDAELQKMALSLSLVTEATANARRKVAALYRALDAGGRWNDSLRS